MASRYDTIARRIFQTLKGYGYKLTLYDENGNKTFVPENARAFFSKRGTLAVFLFQDGNDSSVNVFLSSDATEHMGMLRSLRKTAIKNRVNFNIRKLGKTLSPKMFAYMVANNVTEAKQSEEDETMKMMESKEKIGKSTLIIKHSLQENKKPVVSAIFVESPEGERIKYPYKHLLGARALARHVSNEGSYNDKVAKGIVKLSEDINVLATFANYVWKNRHQLTEDAIELRLAMKEKVNEKKNLLDSLFRESTYKKSCHFLKKANVVNESIYSDKKLKNMLGLVENNELTTQVSKLAQLLSEDTLELDFDDIDVDELRSSSRKLSREKIEKLDLPEDVKKRALLIYDAYKYTAGGFVNAQMEDILGAARKPHVPEAEGWTKYLKDKWNRLVQAKPIKGLETVKRWFESLAHNVDAENYLLGNIFSRIADQLTHLKVNDKLTFELTGSEWNSIMVPFLDLVASGRVIESKSLKQEVDEYLNEWVNKFDPESFLAERKSRFAVETKKKAQKIKESVQKKVLEEKTKCRLDEGQIWVIANETINNLGNKRRIAREFRRLRESEIRAILQTIEDTFKPNLFDQVMRIVKEIGMLPESKPVIPGDMEKDLRNEIEYPSDIEVVDDDSLVDEDADEEITKYQVGVSHTCDNCGDVLHPEDRETEILCRKCKGKEDPIDESFDEYNTVDDPNIKVYVEEYTDNPLLIIERDAHWSIRLHASELQQIHDAIERGASIRIKDDTGRPYDVIVDHEEGTIAFKAVHMTPPAVTKAILTLDNFIPILEEALSRQGVSLEDDVLVDKKKVLSDELAESHDEEYYDELEQKMWDIYNEIYGKGPVPRASIKSYDEEAAKFGYDLGYLDLVDHRSHVTVEAVHPDEVKLKKLKRKPKGSPVGALPWNILKNKKSDLEEVAPPGKKAERFIKQNKAEFKKRYGDNWERVLYATAWKKFGK